MTLTKFIKKHLGKYVKYNKYTDGYQCVDLLKAYLVEVFDFYEKYPSLKKGWAWGDARAWYENYNSHPELVDSFVRIANTPTFTPIAGDCLFWTEGHKYGHTAIAYNNESTVAKIYSMDQNYPKGSKCKYCTHRYASEGFLGVLRPKRRYIKADVNVRTKPSMSGEIIDEYKKGEIVFIFELDSTGKWARVGTGKWVSYAYIEEIGA